MCCREQIITQVKNIHNCKNAVISDDLKCSANSFSCFNQEERREQREREKCRMGTKGREVGKGENWAEMEGWDWDCAEGLDDCAELSV